MNQPRQAAGFALPVASLSLLLLTAASAPLPAQLRSEVRVAVETPFSADAAPPAVGRTPAPPASLRRPIGMPGGDTTHVPDSVLGIASKRRHVLLGLLAAYVVAGVISTEAADGNDFVGAMVFLETFPPAALAGALGGAVNYDHRRDRAMRQRREAAEAARPQ